MKTTTIILIMLASLFTSSIAFSATDKTSTINETLGYKNITPQQTKAILAKDKKAILLDVRTLEEYREVHIPGSVLLPLDQIGSKAQSILKDKNATIIVHCRTGRRSAIAANELYKLGYKKIYNLGGIKDWPYETESGAK